MSEINFLATSIFASRRAADGTTDTKLVSADGQVLNLNFSPDAAYGLLQAILSTRGREALSGWQSWPFDVKAAGRKRYSDGRQALEVVVGDQCSVELSLTEETRQALVAALAHDRTTTDPKKAH